jgi:glycosyltransferase involved in cell wall biosynthesis
LALALVLARWLGVRVVYTVHNLVPHHNRNSYYASLRRLANRLIFVWADAVHVHSYHTAEAIAQSYRRTRNVFVVPHGNYVGWYPNAISRAEARLRLGLSSDAFVYLFLGQIAPYKGLEDLVEAFLALDDPSTRLVIAGRVSRAGHGTHTRIAAMTRHPHVLYRPGFVPDEELQVYFNAADVVVLPYRQITTSASALLALSFGRPVVAPAMGVLSEIVPASVGVSYVPEEPGALMAALRCARRITWSSQAVLTYARQFDWSDVGAQIADIYRTVLLTAEAAVSSQKEQA